MRPATICSIFIQADSPGSAGERWESSKMVRLKPGASLVRLKAQQPFLRASYTYQATDILIRACTLVYHIWSWFLAAYEEKVARKSSSLIADHGHSSKLYWYPTDILVMSGVLL